MATQNGLANIQKDAATTFGNVAAAQNPHPPTKDNVMVFRRGKLYASLDLKSYWDEKAGKYGEEAPRLTTSSDGVFFNLPSDPAILKEFGAFIVKLGDALEGIDLEKTVVVDDVVDAKRKLQKFKGAI